ncbi:MAG: glycerol-3-phosphate acyltransferase [Faecalibacterium prausnitzii]
MLPADAAVSPYLGVYLAAILAVVGHSKPMYFGFKGGKGVLVAAGAILASPAGAAAGAGTSSSSSAWSPPAWCRWAASPWRQPTRC